MRNRRLIIFVFSLMVVSTYAQQGVLTTSDYKLSNNFYRKEPIDSLAWRNSYKLWQLGELNKAEKIADSISKVYYKNKNWSDFLFTRTELAYWHFLKGNTDKTFEITQLSREKLKGKIDSLHEEMLASYMIETRACRIADKREENIKTSEKALEITLHLLNHPPTYTNEGHFLAVSDFLYQTLGNLYLDKKEYAKVINCWQAVMDDLEERENLTRSGHTLNSIASSLIDYDPNTSIAMQESMVKAFPYSRADMKANQNINRINTYIYIKDYKKAEELALKNLKVYRKLLDEQKITVHNYLITLYQLTDIYNFMKDRENLVRYKNIFEKTLKKYKPGNSYYENWKYNIEDNYYRLIQAYDSSHIVLKKILDLEIKEQGTKYNQYVGWDYLALGENERFRGNYNSSLSYLHKSLMSYFPNSIDTTDFFAVPESVESYQPVSVLDVIHNRIICYNHLYNKTKNDIYVKSLSTNIAYFEKLLSYMYTMFQNLDGALALSEEYRETIEHVVDIYFEYGKADARYYDTAYFYAQKSKAFNLKIEMELFKRKAKDDERKALVKQRLKLKEMEQHIKTLSGQDSLWYLIKMNNLRWKHILYQMEADNMEYNVIEDYLKKRSPMASLIADNLEEREAVFDYYVVDDKVYSFVINAGSMQAYKIDIDNNQLKKMVRQVKIEVKTGKQSSYSDTLFRYIVKPVMEGVKRAKNITIIPDKELYQVTFEVLGSNYFINQGINLSYQYTTGLTKKKKVETGSVFALFAPVFEVNDKLAENSRFREIDTTGFKSAFRTSNNETLQPLLNTRDEVEEIRQIAVENQHPTNCYTDGSASKQNLLQQFNKASHIHIATHGYASPNFLESGIFLAQNEQDNGYISFDEIYNQNINANLVVLSACKTGTGEILEGEGIMALPRGFIYAGVSHVIASLWKVHDERTKILMIAFYKHLIEEKVSYAEALRLAKVDCIEKGFLSIDWAGFILIKE